MSDLPTKIFTKENLLCRDRVGAMLFLLFTLGYGYQPHSSPCFRAMSWNPLTPEPYRPF